MSDADITRDLAESSFGFQTSPNIEASCAGGGAIYGLLVHIRGPSDITNRCGEV
jgi:hypothetical protein